MWGLLLDVIDRKGQQVEPWARLSFVVRETSGSILEANLTSVVPAHAGTQAFLRLDTGFRRYDITGDQIRRGDAMRNGFVYILTNRRNGTLYTGVTGNLAKRVYQHKNGLINGFTKKYGVDKLVYYEVHEDIREAIRREKQIKWWHRKWKLELIERSNPNWRDLYDEICV